MSKVWREMFDNRRLAVRTGYLKVTFTLVNMITQGEWKMSWSHERAVATYGGYKWRLNGVLRGCKVNIRKHLLAIVRVEEPEFFDMIVDMLGYELRNLPVFMRLPIERRVNVGRFDDSGQVIVNIGDWSFDINGCNLTVTNDTGVYFLYIPTYGLAVKAIADVGFIRIGARLWCGDAGEISAVRAAADDSVIHVHVLAAVYFCMCVKHPHE